MNFSKSKTGLIMPNLTFNKISEIAIKFENKTMRSCPQFVWALALIYMHILITKTSDMENPHGYSFPIIIIAPAIYMMPKT